MVVAVVQCGRRLKVLFCLWYVLPNIYVLRCLMACVLYCSHSLQGRLFVSLFLQAALRESQREWSMFQKWMVKKNHSRAKYYMDMLTYISGKLVNIFCQCRAEQLSNSCCEFNWTLINRISSLVCWHKLFTRSVTADWVIFVRGFIYSPRWLWRFISLGFWRRVMMTINSFSEERCYVPVSQTTRARAYKIAVFTNSLLFVGFVLWCIRLVSFWYLNLIGATLWLRWRVPQRVKYIFWYDMIWYIC